MSYRCPYCHHVASDSGCGCRGVSPTKYARGLESDLAALQEAATCACGDGFNAGFRGICPNCDAANRSGPECENAALKEQVALLQAQLDASRAASAMMAEAIQGVRASMIFGSMVPPNYTAPWINELSEALNSTTTAPKH